MVSSENSVSMLFCAGFQTSGIVSKSILEWAPCSTISVEMVIVAPVTVSPTGNSIAPSLRLTIVEPSRISISTDALPSANVETLAPAKGARSIKKTRNSGVLLRRVSFDMVSPMHLRTIPLPKTSSLSCHWSLRKNDFYPID